MRRVKLYLPLVLSWLFGCQEAKGPYPVERPQGQGAHDAQGQHCESAKNIWVCRVQSPGEGPEDLATLLPPRRCLQMV